MMRATFSFCLLLVSVPQVAGFGSMPGTISGRTGGTCTGTNRCATTFMGVDFCGYYVVEQEFCYAVQPMIEQCKHLLKSCSESEGGATSSHCKSYDGYEASGLCPERGDAAVDATCKSLASGIPLPPGTWCGSVKDEDVCGQSFLTYPSEVDGYVDTTTYQYCIFDVGQKKCKKNTQWINGVKYDRVAFCDSSCLEGFQTKLTRLSTGAECNKGAGVWDRLNSESTCESTFYTSTDGGTDYKCKWYYDKAPGCSAEWYPSGGAACSCAEGDSCAAMEDMCCDASSCTECSKLG